MKLSEAILAGSVLIDKPEAFDINSCALAMAAEAVGIPRGKHSMDMDRYSAIVGRWPWLADAGEDCPKCGGRYWYDAVVFHVFDTHVIKGEMTLEQLVDYVRTIEPAEEPTPQTEEVEVLVNAI